MMSSAKLPALATIILALGATLCAQEAKAGKNTVTIRGQLRYAPLS